MTTEEIKKLMLKYYNEWCNNHHKSFEIHSTFDEIFYNSSWDKDGNIIIHYDEPLFKNIDDVIKDGVQYYMESLSDYLTTDKNYKELLDIHNKLVNDHNNLVDDYNDAIDKLDYLEELTDVIMEEDWEYETHFRQSLNPFDKR